MPVYRLRPVVRSGMLARDMAMSPGGRVALERDLYQKLLEIRGDGEPEAAAAAILELLVTITDAQRGYLELYPSRDDLEPHWTVSYGCSPGDEEEIRAVTSRGIVAAALASGPALHVPYASLDDRFSKQPSVLGQRLEAVVCIPLGSSGGGVLYLEGRRGGGRFADDDLQATERVAAYLWPSLVQLARAARSH